MDKTIKASTLTGAGVATLMFLVMLFTQAGDSQVGYCQSTGEFCIAVDGFSGGSQTRCYNETDMNWWNAPYCSEGWQIISNDLKVNQTEPNNTIIRDNSKGLGLVKCTQSGCVELSKGN